MFYLICLEVITATRDIFYLSSFATFNLNIYLVKGELWWFLLGLICLCVYVCVFVCVTHLDNYFGSWYSIEAGFGSRETSKNGILGGKCSLWKFSTQTQDLLKLLVFTTDHLRSTVWVSDNSMQSISLTLILPSCSGSNKSKSKVSSTLLKSGKYSALFPLIMKQILSKRLKSRKTENSKLGQFPTTGLEQISWAAKRSLVRRWRYRQHYTGNKTWKHSVNVFYLKLPSCSLDEI